MRVSTQLAIFFIAFNLFGGMMMGLGIDDDLGINLETGDSEKINEAVGKDDAGLGNSVGGTLFGMYNQLTQQVGVIVNTIAPGFAMLKVFLPNAIVEPFAAIAGVFTVVDLLSYARGYSL